MGKSKRMTVVQMMAAFPGKHLVLAECKYRPGGTQDELRSAKVISAHGTWEAACANIPSRLRGMDGYVLFDPTPMTDYQLARQQLLIDKYGRKAA